MSTVLAVSEAKRQLGAIIDRAHLAHDPVYLTRRGHPVVAIVDAIEFDRLLRLAEDAEDAIAAIAARREMAETEQTPVPWDDVKAELGLV
ncbi:type II toxin-antitoxin system Phd/YefM family antitoxin [Curtobacterium sp. Leaf261]|uniref:type II toxin-antitoxin system Phd/YefM family antitoxin n=1 Tax=Curtobacterium sp. Leaf261 TaxID=1736311 RepID=UPI0006FD904A|nr:type II toxin-antitoxin system Phd/YefM family antitoxin [Curtobacterium sp. Leaf261]KQO61302.1 prevent-host-death protein [Curtobacterium sp. Leaf261]